jgi:iron complex transport system permease protein
MHGRDAATRDGRAAPSSGRDTAHRAELATSSLRARWVVAGFACLLLAALLGTTIGPVSIAPHRALLEVLDHVPGVHVDSGLSDAHAAIVWRIRLPRVVLGLLVGGMLSIAGGTYQGAFRNPLADPWLLGIAAGAGLGATIAIIGGSGTSSFGWLQIAAFVGGLLAVGLTFALGASAGGVRAPASLILAGVAVASFFTAIQTYLLQRRSDTIREVYSWMLGHLSGASWHDVAVLLPYVVATSTVLLAARRALDVLAVGDDEAGSLGMSVMTVRIVVVLAATLGTAAAVSVSGLITFVGIIVPHTIRLIAGRSYRVILPLSLLFGGAFLTLADLLARTLEQPAEVPIGVVTAFFGAPFFLVVLRTNRMIDT